MRAINYAKVARAVIFVPNYREDHLSNSEIRNVFDIFMRCLHGYVLKRPFRAKREGKESEPSHLAFGRKGKAFA